MILKPRDVESYDAERALHHVGKGAVDFWNGALRVFDPAEDVKGDVEQQPFHFFVEQDAVLGGPARDGLFDDRLNLRRVLAHGGRLERALHDAAMEAMLVVVAHDEAALEEVGHDRLPTHFGREVLFAIHQDALDVVGVQEQDALVAGDRDATDRAVLFVVVAKERLRVLEHRQGLADEGPSVLALQMAEVSIGRPLVVGKLGSGVHLPSIQGVNLARQVKTYNL